VYKFGDVAPWDSCCFVLVSEACRLLAIVFFSLMYMGRCLVLQFDAGFAWRLVPFTSVFCGLSE
jgi:hypothetical protein